MSINYKVPVSEKHILRPLLTVLPTGILVSISIPHADLHLTQTAAPVHPRQVNLL